jgi:hypothetical protein
MIRNVTVLFPRHDTYKPVMQPLPSGWVGFHSSHSLARHGGRVSELQINKESFHRVPTASAPAPWGLPSFWSDFCFENCNSFLEFCYSTEFPLFPIMCLNYSKLLSTRGAGFKIHVGMLISLWLFLFPVCSTTKRIFFGWVKEVRTTKS